MNTTNTAANVETTETKAPTKADLAREIFAVYGTDKPRKDIIKMFMDDLEMSKAGASTYYHNVKTQAAKARVAETTETASSDDVVVDENDPLRTIDGESASDRKNRIRREKRAIAKAESTEDVDDEEPSAEDLEAIENEEQ